MAGRKIAPHKILVTGRSPKTGRRVYRRATVVGTEVDAEQKRVELRQALHTERRSARLRLADYALSWFVARQAMLRPSTQERYASALDLHVLPALGEHFLDALTWRDIQSYVNERIASSAAGNTIKNELRVLSALAKDALAERLVSIDFTLRVKGPAVSEYTEEEPNLLRIHEVMPFLLAIPRQWLALVLLLSHTGLRWGEASALQWEDVDPTTNEFRVRRSNHKGTLGPVKTKKPRRAPIPPGVLELAPTSSTRVGLMFPTRRDTPHKGTPLRKVLQKAAAKVGLGRRMTPHGLRRTFNDITRRRSDKDVVRAIMGHTTEAMTTHYSSVDVGERRALADDLATATGVEMFLRGLLTEHPDPELPPGLRPDDDDAN